MISCPMVNSNIYCRDHQAPECISFHRYIAFHTLKKYIGNQKHSSVLMRACCPFITTGVWISASIKKAIYFRYIWVHVHFLYIHSFPLNNIRTILSVQLYTLPPLIYSFCGYTLSCNLYCTTAQSLETSGKTLCCITCYLEHWSPSVSLCISDVS